MSSQFKWTHDRARANGYLLCSADVYSRRKWKWMRDYPDYPLNASWGDTGYPCDICRAVFSRLSSLIMHQRLLHSGEKRFVCEHCRAGFNKRQDWVVHVRGHTDDEQKKCEPCGWWFTCRRIPLVKQHHCPRCHHVLNSSVGPNRGQQLTITVSPATSVKLYFSVL